MKKLFIIIFIFPLGLWAQQNPHSTLFQYNHMMVNPGYAGMSDGVNVTTLVRDQWMGFEGNPSNQRINAHMPFKLFGYEHGAGITILNDEIGLETNIGLSLNYSFHKEIAEGKMGLGVGFGFLNQTFDHSKLLDHTGTTPANAPTDDQPIGFQMKVGGFYKTSKMFFGLSANFMPNGITYKAGSESTTGSEFNYKTDAEVNLSFGYTYQLANPLFEIQPSAMVYTSGLSTQFIIDAVLRYKNRFWGGLGYRLTDGIPVIAGAEIIEGLNVGVAYGIPGNHLGSTGSFEFTVQYIFKIGVEKDLNKYKSVRFL